MSKVIKGGTVLTADRSYSADVKIDGGIISEIGDNLSGDEIIDASSCYVMPGGIDPHTHFCLLYTSPSPRDMRRSRMPSSA